MAKQTILFNLDDTLSHCNRYFNWVVDRFANQMNLWFEGVSKDEVKQKQLEIDLEAISRYGLRSDRFPESFVEAYEYFCEVKGRAKKQEEMDFVRKLGFEVFEIPVEPLPYMDETLSRLKEEGHDLYLHTGGDEPNQMRKITQLELTTYFENRIFITEHKDTTALTDILKTIDANPEVTWMVGNSLRTDIVPALEMEINAIFIPTETEWKYNEVDVEIEPKRAFVTINSLKEVPDVIHHYITGHTRFF